MSTSTLDRATPAAGDAHSVADRYPQVVAKLAADERLSAAEAGDRIAEMAKFLTVAAHSDAPVAPSRAVDTAWHAFILFTRDYADFCAATFGRFIHHQPTELGDGHGGDHGDEEADDSAYARTRALLTERFGRLDEQLWPAAGAQCQQEGNCTADCNANCQGGLVRTPPAPPPASPPAPARTATTETATAKTATARTNRMEPSGDTGPPTAHGPLT